MQSVQNNKGFSLVEVMVTTAIFLMMAGGFYGALSVGDTTFQVNSVQTELQSNIRIAMETMIYDLRQAGPSSVINVTADDNPHDFIAFRAPTGVSNGAITWDIQPIMFYTANLDELWRTKGGDFQSITDNISNLEFIRSSAEPDELTVNIEASKFTSKGQRIRYETTFVVQLRN